MKNFWVSAFVSIILVTFFGGFTFPENGFAQTAPEGSICNFSGADTKDGTIQSGHCVSNGTYNNASTAHQITPEEYSTLTSRADQIFSTADAVPKEGLGASLLQDKLESVKTLAKYTIGLSYTTITSVVTNFQGGRGAEYFKNKYLDILKAKYDASKNDPKTTYSTLEVLTLTDYIQTLNDVKIKQKLDVSITPSATTQEIQQAQILLEFTKGILAIAQSRTQLENGTKTSEQHLADTKTILNASQTAMSKVASDANSESCGMLTTSPVMSCISEGITWLVKNIILNIVGFFLWMSANLLNYAMFHGIFKFSEFAPAEIYNIWLVVRQTISLFVFFTGLFVGFMAIIGKSEEFKKYVAFLIVFGLFVNFSYPIVRVFIDISNVVSLQIYQTTFGNEILADTSNQSAGARIMSSMGLQNLVSAATDLPNQGSNNDFLDKVTSLPGALAVTGFVGYAAYIFFMAAFLIIARTAVLVCIIIASPILLVDTIVPALGAKAQWLRGVFISQLFVAPVFTILLALTLKFLSIFGAMNTGSAMSASGANSVSVFFNLIIMLVMLHIMLKITKDVAGEVGTAVTKWAGKAGGVSAGMTLGAGAAIGGAAGRKLFGGIIGERLAQKGGILGDVGRSMVNAKYDLRNLKSVQSGAKMLGVSNLGEGVKKSRAEQLNERDERYLKTSQTIEDQNERGKYLQRMFGEDSKEYNKFTKDNNSILKQYARAGDDEREKMIEDDKYKSFKKQFETINNGNMADMSPEITKALTERIKKEDDTLKAYISASDSQRAKMLANTENNKLKESFEAVNKYYNKNSTQPEKDSAKNSLNPEVKMALDENDALKLANEAIKNAQNTSAQTTNNKFDQMIQGQSDIAQLLRSIANNGTVSNQSGPTIIIPTSGGNGPRQQASQTV